MFILRKPNTTLFRAALFVSFQILKVFIIKKLIAVNGFNT